MKLSSFSVSVTDWADVPVSVQQGARGTAEIQAREIGEIQLRLVTYSPGYLADHWCHKGHIVYVVSGHIVIEHEDGQRYDVAAGASYHVADDDGAPHRVVTERGATAFIVD